MHTPIAVHYQNSFLNFFEDIFDMNHKKAEVNKEGLISKIYPPEPDYGDESMAIVKIIIIIIFPLFALLAFCFREIVRAVKIKGFEAKCIIDEKIGHTSSEINRAKTHFQSIHKRTNNYAKEFFNYYADPYTLEDFKNYADRLKCRYPKFPSYKFTDSSTYCLRSGAFYNPEPPRYMSYKHGFNNSELYMNPEAAFAVEQICAIFEKDEFKYSIESHLNKYDLHTPQTGSLDQMHLYQEQFKTYQTEASNQADTIKERLKTRPESQGREILITLVDDLYKKFDKKIERALKSIEEKKQKVLDQRKPVETGCNSVNFKVASIEGKVAALNEYLLDYTTDEIKTMFGPSEKLKSEEEVTIRFDVIGTLVKDSQNIEVVPFAIASNQNDEDLPVAQQVN